MTGVGIHRYQKWNKLTYDSNDPSYTWWGWKGNLPYFRFHFLCHHCACQVLSNFTFPVIERLPQFTYGSRHESMFTLTLSNSLLELTDHCYRVRFSLGDTHYWPYKTTKLRTVNNLELSSTDRLFCCIFSVARDTIFSKLGSKPGWRMSQPQILPHSHEETSLSEEILNGFVSHLFCLHISALRQPA